MKQRIDSLAARLRPLDPKLKHTVTTAVLSYAVLRRKLHLHPDTSALLALTLSAITGYRVANDGTILRRIEHEDGKR